MVVESVVDAVRRERRMRGSSTSESASDVEEDEEGEVTTNEAPVHQARTKSVDALEGGRGLDAPWPLHTATPASPHSTSKPSCASSESRRTGTTSPCPEQKAYGVCSRVDQRLCQGEGEERGRRTVSTVETCSLEKMTALFRLEFAEA